MPTRAEQASDERDDRRSDAEWLRLHARNTLLESLLMTALALHGGEAHTYSEKEWRTQARNALGITKG